jgi:hypothetical protein
MATTETENAAMTPISDVDVLVKWMLEKADALLATLDKVPRAGEGQRIAIAAVFSEIYSKGADSTFRQFDAGLKKAGL